MYIYIYTYTYSSMIFPARNLHLDCFPACAMFDDTGYYLSGIIQAKEFI